MTQATYRSLSSETALRRIGESFCAGTIERSEWTHQAHIAAAVYLIALRPDIDPETEMPRMIRALNVSHGVANTATGGYHHTITLAFLGGIRAFIRERRSLPPHEIVNQAVGTPFGGVDWLLDYWSKDLLFSPRARREWVEPDRLAWPFASLEE
jgi:hypothetical protein